MRRNSFCGRPKVVVAYEHLAGLWARKPDNVAQQGRFAAAGAAKYHRNLAARKQRIDIAQNHMLAVANAESP